MVLSFPQKLSSQTWKFECWAEMVRILDVGGMRMEICSSWV